MIDHVERNRRQWNEWAKNWVEPGRRDWSTEDVVWGAMRIPEADLRILGELSGKDVLDLGCGTGYFSHWLGKRGGRVVGLDLSEHQLGTARLLQHEFGYRFPLVQAAAEYTPFKNDSFDFILSEYGASIWADPYLWVREAARLLRPGGELVFLVNGRLAMLCVPDEAEILPLVDRLLRPTFGLRFIAWQSDESVTFTLDHGEWIRLLRTNGFEVEDLIELQAPADYDEIAFNWLAPDWARNWPSEEIWRARKKT